MRKDLHAPQHAMSIRYWCSAQPGSLVWISISSQGCMHRVTLPCKIFRARTGSKKSHHYIEGKVGGLANNLPKAQRECGTEAGTDHSISESVQLPKTSLSSVLPLQICCAQPQSLETLCATVFRLSSPPLNSWRHFSCISSDLTVSFNKQIKQTGTCQPPLKPLACSNSWQI